MRTKILVITHRNFTNIVCDVMEELNLPIDLKILEAGFGEVNRLIDLENIATFDIVITSGAHLELIKKDFHELMYTVPIFPLRFTESDLVKALVEAKALSDKVVLMYFNEEEYDLEKYSTILNIDLIRLPFKTMEEAQALLVEYKKKGYHTVVGTSAICELAKKLGCTPILIYSTDSMKLELMKAYQLAATRNKMIKYAKIKESLFEHLNVSVFCWISRESLRM